MMHKNLSYLGFLVGIGLLVIACKNPDSKPDQPDLKPEKQTEKNEKLSEKERILHKIKQLEDEMGKEFTSYNQDLPFELNENWVKLRPGYKEINYNTVSMDQVLKADLEVFKEIIKAAQQIHAIYSDLRVAKKGKKNTLEKNVAILQNIQAKKIKLVQAQEALAKLAP